MAGPTCVLLLPSEVGASDVAAIDELVAMIAGEREGNDFWVTDTTTIGGTFRGAGRPFIISIETDENRTEQEKVQFREEFGWTPQAQVVLAAMCNQPDDHVILAEIAAALAERLQALVDLGGWVPLGDTAGVAAIEYETISETTATYLIVSANVLRRWRNHPNFHMVK